MCLDFLGFPLFAHYIGGLALPSSVCVQFGRVKWLDRQNIRWRSRSCHKPQDSGFFHSLLLTSRTPFLIFVVWKGTWQSLYLLEAISTAVQCCCCFSFGGLQYPRSLPKVCACVPKNPEICQVTKALGVVHSLVGCVCVALFNCHYSIHSCIVSCF